MNNDRETAWLIESQCDGGCKWFSRNSRVWTRDANEALRFSRRKDADEFLTLWNSRVDVQPLVGASVTEHMWIEPAAPAKEWTNKDLTPSFVEAARPLIRWLCEHTNPHAKVIVTPTDAELVTGEICTGPIHDYIKD